MAMLFTLLLSSGCSTMLLTVVALICLMGQGFGANMTLQALTAVNKPAELSSWDFQSDPCSGTRP